MFATWIICNISTTLHITASNLVIVAPILHFRGNSFIILQRSNTFCLPLRHFRLTQKLMMDSNLEQHKTQSTVSVFITLLSETPVLQPLNKSLGLEKVFIYVEIVQVHLLKFLVFKKLLNPQYCGQRRLSFHNRMQCYNLKPYMNVYTAEDKINPNFYFAMYIRLT